MESHKVVKLKNKNFQVGEPFNPYGLFVGSFIPQWLEVRPEISPGAKLAYARMCRHAGEKGECRPNQNLLAAEIGLKKRQTQTYIQELVENRLIRPQRRGQGRSNIYDFLIHEWMFDDVIDVQDAAYQSQFDVQDAALPDAQDAAHPYPYKKRIKEKRKITAPQNGADFSPNLSAEPEKQLSDWQILFGVLAEVCGLDTGIARNAARVGKELRGLMAAKIKPTEKILLEHYGEVKNGYAGWNWYKHDWRGKDKAPTLSQVTETWGNWKIVNCRQQGEFSDRVGEIMMSAMRGAEIADSMVTDA